MGPSKGSSLDLPLPRERSHSVTARSSGSSAAPHGYAELARTHIASLARTHTDEALRTGYPRGHARATKRSLTSCGVGGNWGMSVSRERPIPPALRQSEAHLLPLSLYGWVVVNRYIIRWLSI